MTKLSTCHDAFDAAQKRHNWAEAMSCGNQFHASPPPAEIGIADSHTAPSVIV